MEQQWEWDNLEIQGENVQEKIQHFAEVAGGRLSMVVRTDMLNEIYTLLDHFQKSYQAAIQT